MQWDDKHDINICIDQHIRIWIANHNFIFFVEKKVASLIRKIDRWKHTERGEDLSDQEERKSLYIHACIYTTT